MQNQNQTQEGPNLNNTITTAAIAGTQITVYDATAPVGYLALDEATSNLSGKTGTQPNVWIGDKQTPRVTPVVTIDALLPPCADPNTCTITYPAVSRVPIVSGAANNGDVVLPQFSQTPIQLAGPDANHNGLMLYIGPQITLCPDGTCAQTTNNGTQSNTLVYIVDKVTAGIPSRGILENERFFAIGGTSLGDNLQTGLPQNGGTMPPGTVMRFAISDLLNPTTAGGLNTTQPLPDQFNKPAGGVLPGAFTRFNAFRPDETFAAAVPRGDTHLWVVAGGKDAVTGTVWSNVASRADLQILQDGRSSGSVSIAGITPQGGGGSLVLAGQTVGSTRTDTGRSSAAINANLGSLATGADGQSTHLLGGPDLNQGQISNFAVSQADPRLQSVNTNTPATAITPPAQVQPGTALPVGADPTTATEFTYTRLATNVGPGTATQPAGAVSLQGFASAVVEHSSTSQNTVHAYTTANLGGVGITRNASSNTFGATFTLDPTSVGSIPSDATPVASPVTGAAQATLSFGDRATSGTLPQSAYVTNTTFAALGNTAQPGTRVAMTSIDGDLLKGIEGGEAAGLKASNEHLAWGYFLGDLAMRANGTTIQDHANLGFWVAGRPVGADAIQTLSGTSTYTGGLIGTAVNASGGAASIKTAVGSFTQQWNFGTRSGTIGASFDGANWSGLKATMPTGNVFTGSGAAVSGDRTMSVQGAFFNNGALLNGAHPAAVGGHFAIGNPTGTYGANGVMVGARSP